MTPKKSAKAYSYVRFSTPEQSKGDSLRRQTEAAEVYARRNGLTLDTELNLQDLGVSAFHGKNADTGALGYFKRAVEDGIVESGSYLLVENLDRISRRAARKAVRILEDIVESGITVVTLNDGKAYTEASLDGTDFLIAIIVLMRAHDESAMKATRLRSAWSKKRTDAREQGKAMTSLVPTWMALNEKRRPVLVPEKAAVVRRMVKERLNGSGYEGIAQRLNREKVPTFRRASRWHKGVVQKILRSPALAGTFTPRTRAHVDGKLKLTDQEPIADYFPAVINADTYARLKSTMSAPQARGKYAMAGAASILSGIARCPDCGALLTRVRTGAAKHYYLVCTKVRAGAAQHGRRVRFDAVETALLEDYTVVLDRMPHPDAAVERGMVDAQVTVDVLQDRLRGLLETAEKRPSAAVANRIADLEGQLQDATANLATWSERASATDSKALKLRCLNLGTAIKAKPRDVARINSALRELVTAIVVEHSTGYLRFQWRSGGESNHQVFWPREA